MDKAHPASIQFLLKKGQFEMLINPNIVNENFPQSDAVESHQDRPLAKLAPQEGAKQMSRQGSAVTRQTCDGGMLKGAKRPSTQDRIKASQGETRSHVEPDNQTIWKKSGDYIKGSVEYDLGNDKNKPDNQKHLASASPYAGGKLSLDTDNHLVRNKEAGNSDWVYSATDTRNVLGQAATNAKSKIDDDLSKAWKAQVVDLRAWRDQNKGNTSAEDIHR